MVENRIGWWARTERHASNYGNYAEFAKTGGGGDMSLPTLRSDLKSAGVTLHYTAGKLTARAPDGALTPELTARIKAHKLELVAGQPLYRLIDGTPIHPGYNVHKGREFYVDPRGDWWLLTPMGWYLAWKLDRVRRVFIGGWQ
jgi:hypothetical protein